MPTFHKILISRKTKSFRSSWLSFLKALIYNRRDGVLVRASALQSVDLEFIPLIESYRKTLKNGIYSFSAWRSAFKGGCAEQAGKFACCVLGQGA